MEETKSIFFLLSIFILIFISDNIFVNCKEEYNVLVYPFHSFFPKNNLTGFSESLISDWVYRMLYLKTKTEEGMNISMIFNYDEHEMHTNHMVAVWRDKEVREDKFGRYTININEICNYNYKASNTYHQITDYNKNLHNKQNLCYSSENIVLYKDMDLKQSSVKTFQFVQASNDTNNCFCFGLTDTNNAFEMPRNFFSQAKELINSKKKTWSLFFTNINEGKFIFGDIINNKNLNFYNDNDESNYLDIRQQKILSNTINYRVKFDKLIIGDFMNNSIPSFSIDVHKRYITVDIELYKKIKKLYMLDTAEEKGICKEIDNKYEYFHTDYCNKKQYLEHTNNYNKLNDIIFYYKKEGDEYNFTFSPKELFYEKDDYLYFFIGYGEKYAEYESDESGLNLIPVMFYTFHLGTIFLEKYVAVFDDSVPSLYILKSKEAKEDKGDSFVVKIVIISLLIFVFFALLFLIIGKFFGKKLFGGRKKKANELIDDDYDYSTKEIND